MNLKEIAKQGKKLEDEIGLDIDAILNKLTQEVGEFNDAIQKYRGIYCRKKEDNLDELKKEAGEVLFNLISVCYRIGINPDKLPTYAGFTLAKFRERLQDYKNNTKIK